MALHNCAWCQSLDLPAWEARLTAGESASAVALSTPFSEAAALRHLSHFQPKDGNYDYYDL